MIDNMLTHVSSISTGVVNQGQTQLFRVRFGSSRNNFVQLLIRSRNSNARFVRSLAVTLNIWQC